MTSRLHSTRGNVLLLVLIAVALFAALSFAVNQSTRTGTSGASHDETTLIYSSQTTQYAASVRNSILRMIAAGVEEHRFAFNPPADFDDLNDFSFGVFHPMGGNAAYAFAPPSLMATEAQGEWVFSSRYQINLIGTTNPGSNSANDIIAFLPNVKHRVCRTINRQLGVIGTPGPRGIPIAVSILPPSFPEDAMNSASPGIGPPATAQRTINGIFSGHAFGCADFTPDAEDGLGFVYYHVLFER